MFILRWWSESGCNVERFLSGIDCINRIVELHQRGIWSYNVEEV